MRCTLGETRLLRSSQLQELGKPASDNFVRHQVHAGTTGERQDAIQLDTIRLRRVHVAEKMQSSDAARGYSRTHGERFRHELHELLRIPSLSGDRAHAHDIMRAAEWLAGHLDILGVDNVQVMPTDGHPVVYGEWLGAGSDKPTVLVYGHYDIVPAAIQDGWNTPPFEPTEQDGKIYARGVSDDKGQLFVHLKAFESYVKTSGGAPVNLKFLFEGEEEIGSINLTPFLKAHLDLLKADLCVISDTSMRVIDEPVILHSLRGMTYMEVTVRGPSNDLHSGVWGGAVHNPALALVEILSRLHNPDHSIAVPGFYEDIVSLTPEERLELSKSAITDEQAKQATHVSATWGEATFSIRERVSTRPTIEINGLLSGWTGAGPKTIIPAHAMAKLSCRLVGNQDAEKIYRQVRRYIESITPASVAVQVELVSTSGPALIDYTIPEMQAAARAYQIGWGAEPIFVRGGGSIPVVADIYSLMSIPVIMMGYGLDDDGIHGPNEHLSIEMFHRGVETAIVYLEELASLSSGVDALATLKA
jgi:acetylornithine deacetylase/succinyl-diaminopimelate desuccinylase-like protein